MYHYQHIPGLDCHHKCIAVMDGLVLVEMDGTLVQRGAASKAKRWSRFRMMLGCKDTLDIAQ